MKDFTFHAIERLKQRGIRRDAVALLLSTYDTLVNVGSGRVSYSLSRAGAYNLIAEGCLPSQVEEASRLVAVVAEDEDLVITVLRTVGPAGIRYRRQKKGQPRQGSARSRISATSNASRR